MQLQEHLGFGDLHLGGHRQPPQSPCRRIQCDQSPLCENIAANAKFTVVQIRPGTGGIQRFQGHVLLTDGIVHPDQLLPGRQHPAVIRPGQCLLPPVGFIACLGGKVCALFGAGQPTVPDPCPDTRLAVPAVRLDGQQQVTGIPLSEGQGIRLAEKPECADVHVSVPEGDPAVLPVFRRGHPSDGCPHHRKQRLRILRTEGRKHLQPCRLFGCIQSGGQQQGGKLRYGHNRELLPGILLHQSVKFRKIRR